MCGIKFDPDIIHLGSAMETIPCVHQTTIVFDGLFGPNIPTYDIFSKTQKVSQPMSYHNDMNVFKK